MGYPPPPCAISNNIAVIAVIVILLLILILIIIIIILIFIFICIFIFILIVIVVVMIIQRYLRIICHFHGCVRQGNSSTILRPLQHLV